MVARGSSNKKYWAEKIAEAKEKQKETPLAKAQKAGAPTVKSWRERGSPEKIKGRAEIQTRGDIAQAYLKEQKREVRVQQLAGPKDQVQDLTTQQLAYVPKKTYNETGLKQPLYKTRGGEIQEYDPEKFSKAGIIKNIYYKFRSPRGLGEERITSETAQLIYSGGPIGYAITKGAEFFTMGPRREKKISLAEAKEQTGIRAREETGLTAYEEKLEKFEARVEAYEKAPTQKEYEAIEKRRETLIKEEAVVSEKIETYDIGKTFKEEKRKVPLWSRIKGIDPENIAIMVGLGGAGYKYGKGKLESKYFKPKISIKDIGITREIPSPSKTKKLFKKDALAEVETTRLFRKPTKEVIPIKALSEVEKVSKVSKVRSSPKGPEFKILELQTGAGLRGVEIPTGKVPFTMRSYAKGEQLAFSRTIFIARSSQAEAIGFAKGVGFAKAESPFTYGLGGAKIKSGQNIFYRTGPIVTSFSPKRLGAGGRLIAEEPYKFRRSLSEMAEYSKGIKGEEFYFREIGKKVYEKPAGKYQELGSIRMRELQPVKMGKKGLEYERVITEKGLEKTFLLKDTAPVDFRFVSKKQIVKGRDVDVPVGVSEQMFKQMAIKVAPTKIPAPTKTFPLKAISTGRMDLDIKPIQRGIPAPSRLKQLEDLDLIGRAVTKPKTIYKVSTREALRPVQISKAVQVVSPMQIQDVIQIPAMPLGRGAPAPAISYAFKLPPLTPLLPAFRFGAGDRGGRRKVIKVRTIRKYVPSYTALVFGIKGRKPKGIETGLRIRPITKGFTFAGLFAKPKKKRIIKKIKRR